MKEGLQQFQQTNLTKGKIDYRKGVNGELFAMQINISQISSGHPALMKLPSRLLGKEEGREA